MKTIRNKKVIAEIREYLIDQMDFSGCDVSPKINTEKVLACYEIFRQEKSAEIKQQGTRTAFKDWLQGLCSVLTVAFTYCEQAALLEKWLDIPEDKAFEMVENEKFWDYCTTVFLDMVHELEK